MSNKNLLPENIRLIIYNSLFRPHLEYGILAWGGAKKSLIRRIFLIQKKAMRNIAGVTLRSHTDPLFQSYGILKLNDLITYHNAAFMYKYTKNLLPASFQGMFQQLAEPNRTRNFVAARPRNSKLEQLPKVALPKIWNGLSLTLKTRETFSSFKTDLTKQLIANYNNDHE